MESSALCTAFSSLLSGWKLASGRWKRGCWQAGRIDAGEEHEQQGDFYALVGEAVAYRLPSRSSSAWRASFAGRSAIGSGRSVCRTGQSFVTRTFMELLGAPATDRGAGMQQALA